MIAKHLLPKRHLALLSPHSARLFSTSPVSQNAPSKRAPTGKPHTIDPRWLTMVKSRIGKCIMFGLRPDQVQDAGYILQQLARDWRELVAGSEGFLTGEKYRGLFRHNVAWGEMDVMGMYQSLLMPSSKPRLTPVPGHVNNVMYSRYAETARVNWMRNIALHIDPAHRKEWPTIVNSTGIGLILKSIKVDYKFPMKWPDQISVYYKLAQQPTAPASDPASVELHVMIVSEARQRPAARCYEDIVIYDYKQGRKTPLPSFMADQFKLMWAQQEDVKRRWQQRILDIENQVRSLEMESWDREGAVEDLGSAAKS